MLGLSNSLQVRMALNSLSSCLYPASARILGTLNHAGFYVVLGHILHASSSQAGMTCSLTDF